MARAPLDVHCLDLDAADAAADLRLATPEERERAGRFRNPADGRRLLARRAATRRLLGARLARAPEEVRFRLGGHGKPAVPDSAVAFSTSHSGPMLLVTIGEGLRIGCDIEREDPHRDLLAIADLCFTPREVRRLAAARGAALARAFYDGWTCKEAYLKALGRGMSLPMDSVEIAPGPPARIWPLRGDGTATRWSVASWSPCRGYRAAIVADGEWWLRHHPAAASAAAPA